MAVGSQARDIITLVKAIGWNTVRIHAKVENPLFYDAANRLGLYILQVRWPA